MFNLISRTFNLLLSPWIWFLSLLIIGIIIKKSKLKKYLLIISVSILFIFSNRFIFNNIEKLWEYEPIKTENINSSYDYGIVLGGLASYNEEYNQINFHEASDRLFQALRLYKLGKIKKLIISGGSAKILQTEVKEADFIKTYLLEIGIPTEDILTENKSKNTFENAKFTAELLGNQIDTSTFLLFTSSQHMKRALMAFDKFGIQTTPYSIDYNTNKSEFGIAYFLMPDINTLGEWNAFFHEIIGYYVYKLRSM